MNLRLGLDAKRLFHNKTGLGNYARTLVSNLVELNPDYEFYLYTPGIADEFKGLPLLSEANVVVRDIRSLFGWKRTFGLVKQLEKDGIHIYHGLTNELPYGIHNSYIKSVVTIHDLIFLRYPETYGRIDRWIYDRKSRYACKHSDAVLSISDATAKDIHLYYQTPTDKISTIYQTLAEEYWEPYRPSETRSIVDENYFLYVGSIIERKNIGLMIEAMHLLDKEDIHLVIAGQGKGAYFNELQRQIQKFDLASKITFVNETVDTTEIKNLYQNAKALVFPSKCEGFGLPNLEAAFSKIPIITSSVSSLPESAGPYSTLIDPNSVEELSAAILKVNQNDLSSDVQATYDWAITNFDKNQVTNQVTSLYRSIH